MPVDFFGRELEKAQDRFNSVFGGSVVCDLQVRQALILTISWMGVLRRRIGEAESKNAAKDKIRKFVRLNSRVNTFFNRIESGKGEQPNVEHTQQRQIG